MSILVKKQKLEEDILEMQKLVTDLVKVMKSMKVVPGGRKGKEDASKNQVSPEHIQFLLQTALRADNIILNIQNLLNICTNHNFFLQRQLQLRSCQM